MLGLLRKRSNILKNIKTLKENCEAVKYQDMLWWLGHARALFHGDYPAVSGVCFSFIFLCFSTSSLSFSL